MTNMSADTVPSSSRSGGNDSQTSTEATMDESKKVYEIPQNERINVCYHLDQSNVWEDVAKKMGYEDGDIIVSLLLQLDHSLQY